MKKFTQIIIVALVLSGVVCIAYPFAGSMFSYINQLKAINEYNKEVSELSEEQIEDALKRAEEYGQNLLQNAVSDPFDNFKERRQQNYSGLNLKEKQIGFIKIPEINISLPIYNDTEYWSLQKGVGHLENTALPVGGENTHCVLTGHTGLPTSKLFTDLDKLKLDDYFYIYILNKTLAYKVDQIKIVKPNNTKYLQIIKGEDHITLVTCTPYAINTHRLLVRGIRDDSVLNTGNVVPGVPSEDIVKRKTLWEMILESKFLITCIAVCILLLLLIIILIVHLIIRHKKTIKQK